MIMNNDNDNNDNNDVIIRVIVITLQYTQVRNITIILIIIIIKIIIKIIFSEKPDFEEWVVTGDEDNKNSELMKQFNLPSETLITCMLLLILSFSLSFSL